MSNMVGEMLGSLGSTMAALMFAWTVYEKYFPYELRVQISRHLHKLRRYFQPYIQITFSEYQKDSFQRSKGYTAIERYLDKHSSEQARRLKANIVHDSGSGSVVLGMEDNEQVTDEFEGVRLWWTSRKYTSNRQSISLYPSQDEKRYLSLTFHKKHREIITTMYLKHVLDEGKQIAVRERRRKLYVNNSKKTHSLWSHITFQHPATFDSLAMEPKKKQEIIDDLINFSNSKDYYAKIGKAWKRGYLLYGPPGTGKSTMIAAMANLLNYDVYDLELTSVKNNSELRKLLIDTSSKSIIVIEDIDCSLDLTGQRENKTKNDDKDAIIERKIKKQMEENKSSEVTLSGLLNFIDGLWSACGEERIIVFTTNYVEKLDPALIRRGRMDKHIELSYCGFEAFKELAKIYLNVESHNLFHKIGNLLEETKMTPADVAENVMPKSAGEDADICLERLIKALKQAKEEAKAKAEEQEQERLNSEEEGKEKQKEENADNDEGEGSTESMAK